MRGKERRVLPKVLCTGQDNGSARDLQAHVSPFIMAVQRSAAQRYTHPIGQYLAKDVPEPLCLLTSFSVLPSKDLLVLST